MTQRQALQKLKQRNKSLATPQLDEGPIFPIELADIYSKYIEVSSGKGGTDNLTYTELQAWLSLTQTIVEPGEVELLMLIDRTVIKEMFDYYKSKE